MGVVTVFQQDAKGALVNGIAIGSDSDERDPDVATIAKRAAEHLSVPASSVELLTWPDRTVVYDGTAVGGAAATVQSFSGYARVFVARTRHDVVPVPHGPKPLPYIGNTVDIMYGKHKIFAYNIAQMFDKYGDFISLDMDLLASAEKPELLPLFVADPEIVREMVENETDFPKMWTSKVNKRISGIAGNGLFTSSTTDPHWKTGRPLMARPFNDVKVKGYYDIISDKAARYVEQIAGLVARSGSDEVLVDDVNGFNACFTFDTVIQAALGVDLGDIEAMGEGRPLDPFLPAFRETVRLNPKFSKGWKFYHYTRPFKNAREQRKLEESKATMFSRINDLIEDTRNGVIGENRSVLYSLLNDESPATNKRIEVRTVPSHMITLMVAGHETTAATIGFCMYHLSKNPVAMAKAVAEARSLIGEKGYLEYKEAGKLNYITACIRETLRLYSAVPLLQRESTKDAVVTGMDGQRYHVPAGSKMYIVCRGLHTNKKVWGENANEWNPENFFDEETARKRHPHCYKPFGFGIRSCVGQFFALWEAKVCIAMMVNRFCFRTPENYEFVPAQGLGAAPFPQDLAFYFTPREGALCRQCPPKDTKLTAQPAAAAPPSTEGGAPETANICGAGQDQIRVQVLFGSNTGTCEDLAYSLVEQGEAFGAHVTVSAMDDAVEDLPQENTLTVIICSTYNGHPPDNAKLFLDRLSKKASRDIEGVKYAICGVGNSQWHATFHKFPKQVEKSLDEKGASVLLDPCMLDVSKEWTEDFDEWCSSLWPAMMEEVRGCDPQVDQMKSAMLKVNAVRGPKLTVELVGDECRVPTLGEYFAKNPEAFQVRLLKVLGNQELQNTSLSGRSTRHIEIELPKDMPYKCGGHLAIRPKSSKQLVDMALALLGMTGNEWTLAGYENRTKSSATDLRVETRVPVSILLSLLDLAVMPTQKSLSALSKLTFCPPEANKLSHLGSKEDSGDFEKQIVGPQKILLEVMGEFKSLSLGISDFVNFFPLLKPRYYSISSSPLGGANRCSISVGVVDYTTGTGRRHQGMSSGMLAEMKENECCFGFVRELCNDFVLPESPGVPIIMVGAGTGVAPFMGFLEERSIMQSSGSELGQAMLFFGCRSKAYDFIYQDKLKAYKSSGVLSDLFPAFSRDMGSEKTYVQHVIAKEKRAVWDAIERGAVIYICGDAIRMAPDVKAAFAQVVSSCSHRSEQEAWKFVSAMESSHRYLEDVWGG